jgi:heterodisulfide reductase subunit A
MKEARIGLYVCWCGSNIAKMVDVETIAKELHEIPEVIVARDYKYMCSDPGQDLIIKDIKENNLDRIVVAACSPRIHEATFRKAIEKAGLNPYMFQMANIREQDAWVHNNRDEATQKAKALIKAALKRIKFHEALNKRTVEINPSTLVIGGGVAGLTAALKIADANQKVYLVECEDHLGGTLLQVKNTFPALQDVQEFISEKRSKVLNHTNIEVFTNTNLEEIYGYVGNFGTKLQFNNKTVELEFGNIIIATGLQPFNPIRIPEYDYGELPNVITALEFEQVLLSGKIEKKDGSKPNDVAIIHCVGSLSKDYLPYCSRTCCSTALKYANIIRSSLPEANIYELYTDMRCYGKGCEELYSYTSTRDIMFLMFDMEDGLPKILPADSEMTGEMQIKMLEKLSGEELIVPADMVILMTGMQSRDNAREVAHMAGISMCGNEFFIEKHPKLDPVATTTDGVYIVGACQGPKSIDESVSQAKAAVARILGSICKGVTEVEVTTATVNEDICCGCKTCVQVCPYSAIDFNEEKNVSGVNEVLCKGCGTCSSACATGAIQARHFTDSQILSQIEGVLESENEVL